MLTELRWLEINGQVTLQCRIQVRDANGIKYSKWVNVPLVKQSEEDSSGG